MGIDHVAERRAAREVAQAREAENRILLGKTPKDWQQVQELFSHLDGRVIVKGSVVGEWA